MVSLSIPRMITRLLSPAALAALALSLSCTGSGGIPDDNDDNGGNDGNGNTGSKPVATLQAYNATGAAPLTVGLDASGSSASAGIKSYDYDFDGDGTYDELAGKSDTSHTYTTVGQYTARVRVTDNNGASATATAKVVVSGEVTTTLQADLVIYPASTETGSGVVFDASGSSTNLGTLVFDYDVDGDGDYDLRNAGSSTNYIYNTAGTFTVKVRVTNPSGATATATATVTVSDSSGGGGGSDEIDPPHVALGFYPSAVQTGGVVTLDATSSWSADGSALTFDYDFEGDGTFDQLKAGNSVTHSYTAAGTYHPVVRATDGGGRQSTATTTITVTAAAANQAPVAQLAANPANGAAPLSVQLSAVASYDPDGAIVRYDWDFDDGSTAANGGATQQHSFAAAGVYTVVVTVTDDDGAIDSATATVTVTGGSGGNQPPVADLQATPTSGNAPLTVEFNASASHDPDGTLYSLDIDFGDYEHGGSIAYSAVTHTYSAAGVYQAILEVSDYDGATDTATVTITVGEPAGGLVKPVARLSADPLTGAAPLAVHLDATTSSDADGTLVTFQFDPDGDGDYDQSYSDPACDWTYDTAGTYTALVTVIDDSGLSDRATVTINVTTTGGNTAPVAIVTADVFYGPAPLTVVFSSAYSYDDGTIVRYDWDLDNDGTYENGDGGTEQTVVFTASGQHTVGVKVTDDQGLTGTGTASVWVE